MNWSWREVPVPVAPSFAVVRMRPTVGVEMLLTGFPNWARLNRLNISVRKSSAKRSVTRNCLAIPRSACQRPGPRKRLRPELP